MEVTLLGMVIEARESQKLKTKSPMEVTLLETVTETRASQL